ncbi:hypothetical protein ACSBR1_042677 [Camellia fascicularis]
MVDDIPHAEALPKVPPALSPPTEVEEPAVAEAGEVAEGLAADFEAEFAPGLDMMRFDNFAGDMPEDALLREPYSHLSYSTSEGDSHSCRGYGAVTAGDWYYELPLEVCDLVDEASFGLFCTGLSRHMASQALLRALVERWWDTTNSFHFSSIGEMIMTPYDFSMITGLGAGGDPIPFDMDMGEWEATWIHLLGAHPPLYRPVMAGYNWFSKHFCGSKPETPEEAE